RSACAGDGGSVALRQDDARIRATPRRTEAGNPCPGTKVDDSAAHVRIESGGEENRLQPGAVVAAGRLHRLDMPAQKSVNGRIRLGREIGGGHQRRPDGRLISPPTPASSRSRRAVSTAPLATRMRRGRTPSEPSTTLIF